MSGSTYVRPKDDAPLKDWLRWHASFEIGDGVPPEMLDFAWVASQALDRIEYLESIAGAVTQASEPSQFAKRHSGDA